MSPELEDTSCEDLVFECFVKVLSRKNPVAPGNIPEGFENLNVGELAVLAYLQEISSRRGAATATDAQDVSSEDSAQTESGAASLEVGCSEGDKENLDAASIDLREHAASDATDETVGEGESGELDVNSDGHGGVSLAKARASTQVLKEEAEYIACSMNAIAALNSIDEADAQNEATAGTVVQNEATAESDARVEITADSDVQNKAIDDPDLQKGLAAGPVAEKELTGAPGAQYEATGGSEPEENEALFRGPRSSPQAGGAESSRRDPDRINLKNGRTRQSYEAVIEGYSEILLQDNDGIDLTITPEGEVSGDQIAAGEYTLKLDALKAGRPVNILARLSVIADPRDLWKEVASDQSAANAKVDQASDYRQSDEAFIVAASKRGRSHAQEGKYRDDDFSIRADTQTGWHFLVVADGAGSAELSREGSRIACEEVVAALPELLAQWVDPRLTEFVENYDEDPQAWTLKMRKEYLSSVLPEAALKAAQAIEEEATKLERKPQEFSTTLVIALSKKVLNQWFTASFTIGDGGVAIFDASKVEVAVLCRPDSGEFAGQTRFLASSELADKEDVAGRIFVDLREDFTVLAAMTDGITDPKFPTDAVFEKPQAWSEFWAADICEKVNLSRNSPDIEEQMLSWLDFWSRGNHDDRTIALMLPESEGSEEQVESAAGAKGAAEPEVADSSSDEGGQMSSESNMKSPVPQDEHTQ